MYKKIICISLLKVKLDQFSNQLGQDPTNNFILFQFLSDKFSLYSIFHFLNEFYWLTCTLFELVLSIFIRLDHLHHFNLWLPLPHTCLVICGTLCHTHAWLFLVWCRLTSIERLHKQLSLNQRSRVVSDSVISINCSVLFCSR